MSDFKNMYDRVLLAQASVQELVNQIKEAMAKETDEGAEEALALEEKLDQAIAKRDQLQAFYDKVVNAHQSSEDLMKDFVPVSSTPSEPEGAQPKGTMTRAEYKALSPRDRLAFAKAGGKIESGEQA